MRYPYNIDKNDYGFVVSFPDAPEALTGARDIIIASNLALDCLVTSFEFYQERREPIPLPSKINKGQEFVQIPIGTAAKILLLNEMLAQNVKAAELSRRTGISPQELTRITNLKSNTKIDTINRVLTVLGKRIELRIR